MLKKLFDALFTRNYKLTPYQHPRRFDREALDLYEPFTDRCPTCGGKMYNLRGSNNIVGCSNCGLAYVVLLLDITDSAFTQRNDDGLLME